MVQASSSAPSAAALRLGGRASSLRCCFAVGRGPGRAFSVYWVSWSFWSPWWEVSVYSIWLQTQEGLKSGSERDRWSLKPKSVSLFCSSTEACYDVTALEDLGYLSADLSERPFPLVQTSGQHRGRRGLATTLQNHKDLTTSALIRLAGPTWWTSDADGLAE